MQLLYMGELCHNIFNAKLSNSAGISGMLFADDFVGISDSEEQLQKLIDVVLIVVNGG